MKKLLLSIITLCIYATAYSQPYAVGHTQINFTDPARSNRAVPVDIYYPALTAGNNVPVTGTTYPVVVFGHGFVMAWSAYQNVWSAFVPSGYILVFPTTESGFSPVHADFGMDLVFLVGKMQSESATNSSSIFYNHVDTASAIMGHSMGGGSSFLACENNLNVTTMITFAAANTTPSSITAAAHIHIPSLVIAGQNDCVAPPVSNQIPMYDSLASACKAYVEIKGGGHCYFAESNFNCSFGEGTCSPNPTITRGQQEDAAQDYSLMWLNYYLKGDCAAWQNFNDSLNVSPRITSHISCTTLVPIISQNLNVLTSTPASTYQWLLNGVPIVGATSQNYTPVQNGVYSVQVTYSNPCPIISNSISWSVTGLPDASSISGFKLFPNPGVGIYSISFVGYVTASAKLYVSNSLGEEILVQKISVQRGSNLFTINLDAVSCGYYAVRLVLENGQTSVAKLVKQ